MIDIKQFRKSNKLTQKELAEYLDIPIPFLSAIENGRNRFPKERLIKLMKNDRGWDVSNLESSAEEVPTQRKSLCGPSRDIELVLQENAQLRERCSQLEEQNGKFWALIEKLTNKK